LTAIIIITLLDYTELTIFIPLILISLFLQARFAGAEAKKKADELKTPSCDEFQRRFVDKFDR
jgi:hypothetical protein